MDAAYRVSFVYKDERMELASFGASLSTALARALAASKEFSNIAVIERSEREIDFMG